MNAQTKPSIKIPTPHKNEKLMMVNPTEPITEKPPKINLKISSRKSRPTGHPCCVARSSYVITMKPAALAVVREANSGIDISKA